MMICSDIHQIPAIKHLVLTIGSYDGVHLGHQQILKQAVAKAKEIGGSSGVLTFDPHPRQVLFPESGGVPLLTSRSEKASIIKEMGIDYLFVIPFDKEFASLNPLEYIESVLVKRFNPSVVMVGYDHRFGLDREGGIATLRATTSKFDYEVVEISEQEVNDVTVSSTKIRRALASGYIKEVNEYLGYPYPLSGTVAHGNKIGNTIGFPTANIDIDNSYKLLPPNGVFAVSVRLASGNYDGMMYIGERPTIDGVQRRIEVNIFDFSQDIYGEQISVSILYKIREDIRFENLESLSTQLQKDKETSLTLLR